MEQKIESNIGTKNRFIDLYNNHKIKIYIFIILIIITFTVILLKSANDKKMF